MYIARKAAQLDVEMSPVCDNYVHMLQFSDGAVVSVPASIQEGEPPAAGGKAGRQHSSEMGPLSAVECSVCLICEVQVYCHSWLYVCTASPPYPFKIHVCQQGVFQGHTSCMVCACQDDK